MMNITNNPNQGEGKEMKLLKLYGYEPTEKEPTEEMKRNCNAILEHHYKKYGHSENGKETIVRALALLAKKCREEMLEWENLEL